MSIRKDAVDSLVADLEESGIFKKVYQNIVPIWTKVNNVPSVSVIYSEEFADSDALTTNKIKYTGSILVYIYNKQSPTKYDDILSDLIDEVQNIVLSNNYLRCNTIETLVSNVKIDGGTVHPWSIAQLKIRVKYINRY